MREVIVIISIVFRNYVYYVKVEFRFMIFSVCIISVINIINLNLWFLVFIICNYCNVINFDLWFLVFEIFVYVIVVINKFYNACYISIIILFN